MSEIEIWEGVHKGDPELRSTWNSQLIYVCRVCQFEKPHHHKDCPIAALVAKLEATERVVRAVKDYAHSGPSGELWDVVMRALAAQQGEEDE